MGYFDNMRQKLTGGGQSAPQQQSMPQNNQQGQQPQNPAQRDPNQNQQSLLPGNGSQATGNPQQPLDPLDAYQNLYTTTDANNTEAPSFKLDGDKFKGLVDSQNFTQGMSPELLQKAMSGDQTAFMEALNFVGRNAYKSSLEHGSTLTDKFVGARFDYEGKGLGSKIRDNLVDASLTNVPGFSHPVARTELVKVAKQLAKQHPDASPEDIAAEARRYLTELGNHLNPDSRTNQQQKQKAAEVDWDQFMSLDDQN